VDSLLNLLDQLLAQLLVRQAGVSPQSVGALTSQSLPAIRAYLAGRSNYRVGRNSAAVRDFERALDIDSTFALAALDLATATTKLIRQRTCANTMCSYRSTTPGFRDGSPESDNLSFERAIRLAYASRAKLGSRDRPQLDALRGRHWPAPSSAREVLGDLQAADNAAPDRADTKYLLGLMMLYQGPSLGYSDAWVRAEAHFNDALRLDGTFLPPLARLVEVAAYARDAPKLRRYASMYLALDPVGATSDYVRWRAAAAMNDRRALSAIRARFESLDLGTLRQIVTASQMSGLAMDDADRAATLIIARTTDPLERALSLYWMHILALNRGRPHEANRLLGLRRELDSASMGFWQSTNYAALLGDGDSAEAAHSASERARFLARDTLLNGTRPRTARGAQDSMFTLTHANSEGLWYWAQGRTRDAEQVIRFLRRNGDIETADVIEMLIATDANRIDADALRARVESAITRACCARVRAHTSLLLAVAYERGRRYADALRIVRRNRWSSPAFLSTWLRMEGRLAGQLGDREGALRAYEHYLALRSNPERRLLPERESIRAEVSRLRRGR
jgi:tetratricopeptide (TPR) repeat protein